MIYPLCLRMVQKVEGTIASHYTGQSKLSEGNSNGSYPMQGYKEKKSKKFIHPLSMRNATASGSAESIVRAERIKDGRDISIVKEATVVISSPSQSEENIRHYPGGKGSGTGYAVTCNA